MAEQPLKKRKLYEQLQEPSSPPPHTPPPQPPAAAAQPLTHEEILRRQRNLEEIRKVFNCVKKIRRCISDGEERRHLTELEQAYLYLITASRG